MARKKKKQGRAKEISGSISPRLAESVSKYRKSQSVPTTKSKVVRIALEYFLRKEGYYQK